VLRTGTEPPVKSKHWLADHFRRKVWLHHCYWCFNLQPDCVYWTVKMRDLEDQQYCASVCRVLCIHVLYICPQQQDIIQNKLYVMCSRFYSPFFPSLFNRLAWSKLHYNIRQAEAETELIHLPPTPTYSPPPPSQRQWWQRRRCWRRRRWWWWWWCQKEDTDRRWNHTMRQTWHYTSRQKRIYFYILHNKSVLKKKLQMLKLEDLLTEVQCTWNVKVDVT
jgi:hypothetical protein